MIVELKKKPTKSRHTGWVCRGLIILSIYAYLCKYQKATRLDSDWCWFFLPYFCINQSWWLCRTDLPQQHQQRRLARSLSVSLCTKRCLTYEMQIKQDVLSRWHPEICLEPAMVQYQLLYGSVKFSLQYHYSVRQTILKTSSSFPWKA